MVKQREHVLVVAHLLAAHRVVEVRVLEWDLLEHLVEEHVVGAVALDEFLELGDDRMHRYTRLPVNFGYEGLKPSLRNAVITREPTANAVWWWRRLG